jgi:two-component system, NtrC family, sensor kinase
MKDPGAPLGHLSKGHITLRTRSLEGRVEIRIEDDGPGIPPPIQSRIFDYFFTTKDIDKGTGQGLAIAHNVIVDRHGGLIRFETSPSGTTFIITLPTELSDL